MKRKNPTIVAVLGAGNFGTAFAHVLGENGHRVHLWNWEGEHEPLKQIEKFYENKIYLPGVKLSKRIVPVYSIEDALKGVEVVFFAIPSNVLEHTISFASRHIEPETILVNLSKGFHPQLLLPMSDIISKHVKPGLRKNISAISGPAVAIQMAQHQITFMNVASRDKKTCFRIKQIVANQFVHIIPTDDLIGVEIGGSFKNVYSILMGICDGMMISLNTKAALITSAVDEIARVISALGGRKSTAYELAGLGDLLGTAFCETSRNHRFGVYVGRGYKIEDAKTKVRQTIEGISAVKCLIMIAKKHHINLPLAGLVYSIIYEKGDARKKLEKFLLKAEEDK